MKKISVNKLNLNKNTVSNLDETKLKDIKGGARIPFPTIYCDTVTECG